ncbi:MAG: TRAP transporter small permease [Clostridia bacterium]|nr:TRAP transporter small permease [Clostridia bacterium]MBQ6427108.1 TRAP transporter small permease [Clostridia bacterium]
MKVLKWIDDHFEEVLLIILMWALVIVMTLGVVFRYVFRSSLSWSDEVCRYVFIWFTYLGLSYGVLKGAHTRIDIIETLHPKLKKPLEYIGDALFFAFSIFILRHAYTTWVNLRLSNQTSPAMRLPMWIVYMSFMVGFTLVIIRFIEKYIKKLVARRKGAQT